MVSGLDARIWKRGEPCPVILSHLEVGPASSETTRNRKAGWNYGLEKEKRREEARRNLLKIKW